MPINIPARHNEKLQQIMEIINADEEHAIELSAHVLHEWCIAKRYTSVNGKLTLGREGALGWRSL